jgi:hypothetical protein
MVALGLLHTKTGVRFITGRDWNSFSWGGRKTRFWPADDLLALATSHGVTADRIDNAFRAVALTRAPEVRNPVELRKDPDKKLQGKAHRQRRSGVNLHFGPEDPQVKALSQTVLDHNAFAARFQVSGVAPPQWFRIFNRNWRLGGRWYAAGHDQGSAYLYLPERERLRDIRINGEPVVEVDVKASHLTILHGLLGLVLPEHDLYTIHPDIPRDTAKAWLTTNLGKGKAGFRWSSSVRHELRTVKGKVVRDAMVAAYPFLDDLLQVVPADLREEEGDDTDLVPLHLQAIEASALTDAITYVRSQGILALPTHDGLIVPQSAVAVAREGLEMGYQRWAKITPKTDTEYPEAQLGEGGPASARISTGA